MKNEKDKGAVKNSKETLKPVDDRNVGKRKASYKPDKSSTQNPKKAFDSYKPRRPPSAFFVFMEEFRNIFNAENPWVKSVSAVGKAGGAKWKSLTNAEKAPYVAKAAQRKAEYEKLIKAYNTKKASSADDAGEMEILFKDIVATGNGGWAPSQDPEGVAGQNSNKMHTPMTEERGVEDLSVKREEYEGTEDLTTDPSNVPTLGDCLDMLKQLSGLQYGSETHILGIRLMKSKSNREIFVLLNDPVLKLKWIESHTLADVSGH